jgi:hypothetical protein
MGDFFLCVYQEDDKVFTGIAHAIAIAWLFWQLRRARMLCAAVFLVLRIIYRPCTCSCSCRYMSMELYLARARGWWCTRFTPSVLLFWPTFTEFKTRLT